MLRLGLREVDGLKAADAALIRPGTLADLHAYGELLRHLNEERPIRRCPLVQQQECSSAPYPCGHAGGTS